MGRNDAGRSAVTEVHLRELIVLNQDTGLWQPHEYEKLELWGWAFPVVANQRLEIRPNFLGMDLTQAGVNWAFADLMQQKESNALKAKQVADPEWLQLGLAFWMDYDHVKLKNPYSWYVGTRYGETAELKALEDEEYKPYLSVPEPLETPENLPSMTHGMKDKKSWAMSFRFPLPAGNSWEQQPLSAHLEARKCPDEGCLQGLPDRQQNWSHYIRWSEKFGDVQGQAVEIQKEDWILYDMDVQELVNLTIYGKLSFDDSADRILQSGSILVWGTMEIGTPEKPFGLETKKTMRIKLKGYVLNTEEYVYVEEQSLWGKVIAVPGTFNTYGAPIEQTWLRLASTIAGSDESACVTNTSGPLDWPVGSEVAFSVTEFDNPWRESKSRILTQDPEYDAENDCWRIHWSGSLGERRFAEDVPVNDEGKTVALRAAVARLDRTIIIESANMDQTGGSMYGGHIEVFDVALGDLAGSSVVGELNMQYTRFHYLGKGALSAAVKVTYSSNFEPPPVLIFHGNSWTESVEYALHLESANVPVLITNNVMFRSKNGGIFSQQGSRALQIKDNCIIGLWLADTAPRMTLQNEDDVVVPQYAGIRLDELPVRMLGNLVSGSRDMGYLTPAEPCPPRAIFNNEAAGVIIGVYLLTAKGSSCQTSNLWTVWKAAHVGIYLSDFTAPRTIISNVVVSDSHMGILPYMSVGSAFRRIYIQNSIIMGTSPAGSDCTKSAWCRTQTLNDPYMDTCNSMYIGADLRRVGFVAAIQTANKKSCWTTMEYSACRLMSTAQPKLNDCHQPYEKDIHMQKGLGWTFFTDTTFAYWKSSDCGLSSSAISVNMWAAEVSFPATFTRTTWYQSDPDARFELSTERLDSAYAGRASPCKSTGGGCMGLDQMLIQDTDGTLTGRVPLATLDRRSETASLGAAKSGMGAEHASILPYTPRTDIVWASMCNNSLHDTTIGAQATRAVRLILNRGGAKDVKFGPLVLAPAEHPSNESEVLTPDEEEDNGFEGGVLSSRESRELRYWNTQTTESVLLEIFYPDSRGVNVFVGNAKKPDMALKLGRKPTLDDEHGAHVVDAQALRLYVTMRGSQAGFDARQDLTIRRTPTVKLKMNIEISIEEFNGPTFQTNLAILLGIPPERIIVASVQARRRLKLVEMTEDAELSCFEDHCQRGRRLATVDQTALDISIEPSADAAAAATGGDSSSSGTDALNAQASELGEVSNNLQALSTGSELAQAAGGEVVVSDLEVPAAPDEAALEEVPSEEDTAEVQIVDVTATAASSAAAEVSAEAGCSAAFGATVTVGQTEGIAYLEADLDHGGSATV
ncbi:unnamed protein product [Durusdinium trenchii]|uniref:G8 domain-containing protein n=1 Tax=Durusdinium trenchii TaxID=1381693 RepID=A0ABP0KAF9_9DINO